MYAIEHGHHLANTPEVIHSSVQFTKSNSRCDRTWDDLYILQEKVTSQQHLEHLNSCPRRQKVTAYFDNISN